MNYIGEKIIFTPPHPAPSCLSGQDRAGLISHTFLSKVEKLERMPPPWTLGFEPKAAIAQGPVKPPNAVSRATCRAEPGEHLSLLSPGIARVALRPKALHYALCTSFVFLICFTLCMPQIAHFFPETSLSRAPCIEFL